MNKIITFLSVIMLFAANINLFAESEWLGKWQSEIQSMETENVVMEYDFIDESNMSLCFVASNSISGVGKCIYKCFIKGTYSKIGPIFLLSINPESLEVSLVKSKLIKPRNTKLLQELTSSAKLLFQGIDGITMIYVTHEDPNVISFIVGDENNSAEMVFHRPKINIEQVLDLNEDTDLETSPKELSPLAQMWKSFGLFMSYIILSFLFLLVIKALFSKHISREKRAKDSVMVRRIYSYSRLVFGSVIVIVGIVIWIRFLIHSITVSQYMAILALCSGGSILLHVFSSLSLPVHFTTINKFKKDKRDFVLYLRGFITDDYAPAMNDFADKVSDAVPWKANPVLDKEKKPDSNSLPLREKALAKVWGKHYHVYCVGQPDELESPEGFNRIYLDNPTWQEDVKYLMESASYILVCVHPNPNCVWEIKQCNSLFAEKTIYFIDNIENLKSIREMLGDELPLCLSSELLEHSHMVAYQNNDMVTVEPYSNNEAGILAQYTQYFNLKKS